MFGGFNAKAKKNLRKESVIYSDQGLQKLYKVCTKRVIND